MGQLQGSALTKKLADDGNPTGPIVRVNGYPSDNNAKLFGSRRSIGVRARQAFRSRKEYDTPEWDADQAQNEMDQAITALGKTGFHGVYSMNDNIAGGVIVAMENAGVDPKTIPVTGQDAESSGIQRILAGEPVHDRLQGDQA